MHKRIAIVTGLVVAAALALTPIAMAKVSPEEAQKLKGELTPWGAEMAGNADGTIPAYTGGISTPPAGYGGPGSLYVDPYQDDKPLYSITAKNMAQYEEKLTPGLKALFKKYPDTYRIDVYPTRRSHALPEWVNENTYKNATRAVSTPDGLELTGAYGGIPFPIPNNGVEVMWNHILRYWSSGQNTKYGSFLIQPTGTVTTGEGGWSYDRMAYYLKDGSLENFNGNFWNILFETNQPARKKGEVTLIKDNVNAAKDPRKAWVYLVGQRRVRRAPTYAFDTPTTSLSGLYTIDDFYGFSGSMERFDWKLVGKKEMYIPYNNYKTEEKTNSVQDMSKIYPAKHHNPDYVRFELHRVWVVEATLKEGSRHIYGKRVFYFDEDSWNASLGDNYDGRGELWRTKWMHSYNAYELPGVIQRSQVFYDLRTPEYGVGFAQNPYKGMSEFDNPKEDDFFTPQNVRRRGKY